MNTRNWIVAVAVLALAACGQEDAPRVELGQDTAQQAGTRRADWPEGLAARVDSANAAYAAGDYEVAAEVYRELTAEHPDIGTVWFGLYMAEDGLGNAEAARAALEQAEAINPGLGQMHNQAEAQAQDPHAGIMMPAGTTGVDAMGEEDATPEGDEGG